MNHVTDAWARMFARLAAAWSEFIREVREAAYVPEGVDDPRWQDELVRMATPMLRARLEHEEAQAQALKTGEVPVVYVNSNGFPVVTVTEATPVVLAKAKRKHRKLTAEERMQRAEAKFNKSVEAIVAEAMLELGLSPSEILHEWSRSLSEELADLRVWQG